MMTGVIARMRAVILAMTRIITVMMFMMILLTDNHSDDNDASEKRG